MHPPKTWRKLGKVFDPRHFNLANDCVEFAQSPQTLIFDKYLRVYFSTRSMDKTKGKYLSQIAYVDFSEDFAEIIGVSNHKVIELGKLGCFDEHGIFPINILKHKEVIFAYTCGWSRRVSVSVETGIGLAMSCDAGRTFQRLGDGPVLSASLHEPCLVGDGFVKVYNDIFHMWYIFGTGWKKFSSAAAPDRTYKIGYASSEDGVHWAKLGGQIITDRLGPDESQALPTVIMIGDQYHMFFCYRQSFDFRTNSGRGYRIGHASSVDAVNWIRADDTFAIEPSVGEWDSDMLCYPHVFEWKEKIYMLYNGNEFGRHGFGLAVLE